MGRAFNEREKEKIIKGLKENLTELVKKKGLKNTTIDELVDMTGIAKGSFYNFFPSKEVLFFEILQDFHAEINDVLINRLQKSGGKLSKNEFVEILYELIEFSEKSFVFVLLDQREYYSYIRKLPEELLTNHQKDDGIFFLEFKKYLNIKKDIDFDFISGTLRGILLLYLHKKEIGDNFNEIIKLLLKGVADYIIED